MGRLGAVFLICMFVAQAARADDALLKDLSAKLVAIRSTHGANTMRDAGPELTPIKHDLRAWIERQLHSLGPVGHPDQFAKQLNAILRTANLICDGARCEGAGAGASDSDRGFLSDIGAEYANYQRYLTVTTFVGVRCGYDASAYVYEWRQDGWHLVFQTEQDRYDENVYAPQNFSSIQISSKFKPDKGEQVLAPLVLTVGYSPWCVSNWQSLYTRLWRVSANDLAPAPMVDSTDVVFLDDGIAGARLTPDEAIIEFDGNSIDGAQGVRTHVFHYLVDGNKAGRVAPLALNPNDFVDEWLTRPWSESRRWIDAQGDVKALEKGYDASRDKDGLVLGEFDGPSFRCRKDPTLWQVAFGEDDSKSGPYFLVRWLAPYRFTLVDIRTDKSRDCDVKDPMRDNVGTLFPFH